MSSFVKSMTSVTSGSRLIVTGLGTAILLSYSMKTYSQTADPGLGLPGLPYANGVETAAADANQFVFERLDESCNPAGRYDQIPDPVFPDPTDTGPPLAAECNADVFFVYVNARELVHTANDLRGTGTNVSSLRVDQEGLGLALRWTAAEEFAVQSSMATEFTNSQLSSLAGRLRALRTGAAGLGTSGAYRFGQRDRRVLLAQAGGDSVERAPREEFSPWGGFLNAGFGYGAKVPTPLEDAFDFDGSELTFGVDYRFDNNVVFGGIFGYTEQTIDFDEAASAISVVDGGMESEGSSVILFGYYGGERMSINGALGRQSFDYDAERNIKYPSFNPETGSTNSAAFSTPKSDINVASFEFSYRFGQRFFTYEPYFSTVYLDVSIDTFAEQRSINKLGSPGDTKRFDLLISGQDFESLETAAGLRFQYVTNRFIPYWSIAAHRELKDDSRIISAGYAALADIFEANSFQVATDAPDDSYTSATIGFTVAIRSGRQRELGGLVRGGVMGFFQLQSIQGLANYDDQVMTGGVRYEF